MRLLLPVLLLLAACGAPRPPSPSPPDAASPSQPMSQPATQPAPALRDRADFARLLATIRPGASADEVLRVLGQPDDVKTERDPGGISAARTAEIWRWGTCGHLTFATLGSIHIQGDRRVQYVFGGAGAPPAGLDEAELRRLLRLLDAVPSYNAPLDPLALIRAVNALQPLGKERALAVIDEYLRVSSWLDDPGREGVFLVLLALFDPPAGAALPAMHVGGAARQPPADLLALPRWPLVLVDDIPLKLVPGYVLGGQAQPPEDYLRWFREHGALRAAPLTPPPRPLEAVDAAVEGRLAQVLRVDDQLRVELYDQALRLLGTVRPSSTLDGWFPHGPDVAARWKAARAEVGALAPQWSTAEVRYTLPGGAIVPPPPTLAQRVWWDFGLPGTAVSRVLFERREGDVVEVELRIELLPQGRVEASSLRVLDVDGKLLATLAIEPVGLGVATRVARQRLHAPGRELRLELVSQGRTTAGPTLALPDLVWSEPPACTESMGN